MEWGTDSLARKLGVSRWRAEELLQTHRRIFPVYWHWSDAAVDYAQLNGDISTVFGWRLHMTTGTNLRTVRNFPMQANGAEIMRVAAIKAVQAGVQVCAPVHDAFLIEAPLDQIDDAVVTMKRCMRDAGEVVLKGFPLRSDAKVWRYPERFQDKRGIAMWRLVQRVLGIIAGDTGVVSLAVPLPI